VHARGRGHPWTGDRAKGPDDRAAKEAVEQNQCGSIGRGRGPARGTGSRENLPDATRETPASARSLAKMTPSPVAYSHARRVSGDIDLGRDVTSPWRHKPNEIILFIREITLEQSKEHKLAS